MSDWLKRFVLTRLALIRLFSSCNNILQKKNYATYISDLRLAEHIFVPIYGNDFYIN